VDASRQVESLFSEDVLDVERIRGEFPILETEHRGRKLVYLDNAATTQKPQRVIQRVSRYYEAQNANIHRAVHHLGEVATECYEHARKSVQEFINAGASEEIIFVRGCTEAINLVASTFGRITVQAGDEVLVSAMEHHSNIVPWQMLCEEKGASLNVIPMNVDGDLILNNLDELLTPRTRLVAVTQVSNALGTVNPVKEIIARAHARGIPVLVDGAQAVNHFKVDVQELDADFYASSGHKVYGPMGIGVLYGKRTYLEAMPPYQGGGDMIRSVSFAKTSYNDLPYKFEAGTPNVEGAVGLAEALEFVSELGIDNIAAHESDLMDYAVGRLRDLDKVRIIGNPGRRAGAISFVVENIHPHDLGTFLDQMGVAVRTGHHCAQPVMEFYDIPATARLSFAVYNTRQDIDLFTEALASTIEVFK